MTSRQTDIHTYIHTYIQEVALNVLSDVKIDVCLRTNLGIKSIFLNSDYFPRKCISCRCYKCLSIGMDPIYIQPSRILPNDFPSQQVNELDLETIIEEILEIVKGIDENELQLL